MKLILAEHPFVSIQGEGNTINTPSFFIRFFGCNHSCSFCDSKFSWENKTTRIEEEADDVIDKILKERIPNVIFTGGEPLLYQFKILYIIEQLKKKNYNGTFEIETNGAILLEKQFLSFLFNRQIRIQFNISPKPEFYSNDEKVEDTIKRNIDFLVCYGIKFILKFVDEKKYRKIILSSLQLWGIFDTIEVYIMPECQTREEHLNKASDTINFCKENNFNFCPRLHILLWDNKKGV